jgi:hypothetical protein
MIFLKLNYVWYGAGTHQSLYIVVVLLRLSDFVSTGTAPRL